MARIAWLVDFEVGHILPTFRLAKDLSRNGHELRYLGLPDAEREVVREGFTFVRMLEHLFPAGFYRSLAENGPITAREEPRRRCFLELIQGTALDNALKDWRPDFFIVGGFFLPEALVIRHRYHLPVAVFTTHFTNQSRIESCRNVLEELATANDEPIRALADLLGRNGLSARTPPAIARLMLTVPELVLCPEVFELPTRPRLPLTYHVGTGIDLDRVDQPFDWPSVNLTGKRLILCTMGSRTLDREAIIRFFRIVAGAAGQRPAWELIIAVGRDLDASIFDRVPPNVHVRPWVPQLEVLRRTDLMINHGGTGTVKECVLLGVRMAAFALGRDQFQAVERIRHHGLGVHGDLDLVTTADMIALISGALESDAITHRLKWMQEQFRQADAGAPGVTAIESLLHAALHRAAPVTATI